MWYHLLIELSREVQDHAFQAIVILPQLADKHAIIRAHSLRLNIFVINMQQGAPKTSYERSRLGLQFGATFESGIVAMDFALVTTDAKSQEQIEQLKAQVGDNIDLDWAMVLKLQTSDGDKLRQAIEGLHAKDFATYLTGTVLRVHSTPTHVWVSLRLPTDLENDYVGLLQVLLDGGLAQLASEQENSIDGLIEFNQDFNTVDQLVQQQERLISVLLRSMRAELNLNLHNDFSGKVKQIVKSIDPEFLESPPMMMITYFKNYDIDLTFNSTEDLPEQVRKQVLFGKKLQSIPEEERKIRVDLYPSIQQFVESIGSEASIYVTVQGVAALSVNLKAPTLGSFILKYGRALRKIFAGVQEAQYDKPEEA